MKSRIIQQKLISAIVVVLFAASMTITVVYHQSNHALKSGLKEEKLKSESLLSEKLALAKELEKLKTDIPIGMGKSPKTDRLLEEATTIGSMEKTVPTSLPKQGL